MSVVRARLLLLSQLLEFLLPLLVSLAELLFVDFHGSELLHFFLAEDLFQFLFADVFGTEAALHLNGLYSSDR